jgi:hypothetical protein
MTAAEIKVLAEFLDVLGISPPAKVWVSAAQVSLLEAAFSILSVAVNDETAVGLCVARFVDKPATFYSLEMIQHLSLIGLNREQMIEAAENPIAYIKANCSDEQIKKFMMMRINYIAHTLQGGLTNATEATPETCGMVPPSTYEQLRAMRDRDQNNRSRSEDS